MTDTEERLGALATRVRSQMPPVEDLVAAGERLVRRRRARRAAATGAVGAVVVAGLVAWGTSGGERDGVGPAHDRQTPPVATPSAVGVPPGRPVDLPTSPWRPGDASMAAQIDGMLVAEGDCMAVKGGGHEYVVVWPSGYRGLRSGPALFVFDQDGQLVAYQGQHVKAGGGFVPAADAGAGDSPCLRGQDQVVVIQSAVEVIDEDPAYAPPLTEAALQGDWTVKIAGVIDPDGHEEFDTFRDVAMSMSFGGGRVTVDDGCNTYEGDYTLVSSALPGLSSDLAVTSLQALSQHTCARQPPLVTILGGIRQAQLIQGQLQLIGDNQHGIQVALERAR